MQLDCILRILRVMVRVRVRVSVSISVAISVSVRGGAFPQADLQCINTQQMYTYGLCIELCHIP